MRTPALSALLARLDAEQAAVAAWHPQDGALRVVACAGAGKTTTLTALTGRLLADGIVPPHALVLTTFTKKAADELRQRLDVMLPSHLLRPLRMGTFHSLAHQALRGTGRWSMSRCLDMGGERAGDIPPGWAFWTSAVEYGHMPGTHQPSLRIKAEADARIYQHAADLLMSEGVDTPEHAEYPTAILRAEARVGAKLPQFDEAWRLVLDAKRALHAWDFADLLLAWAKHIKQIGAGDVQAVIVDEAQDNTRVQGDIAQALAGAHRPLVLCGDGRQCVHEWRGAYPELFLDAETRLGARTLSIATNYRSTSAIVDAGNRIAIGQPWGSVAARPARDLPGTVTGIAACDVPSAVVADIRKLLAAGLQLRDVAVICRTNAELGEFQGALTERDIPCVVVGGKSIFEHREVLAVMAYLLLADGYELRDALNCCMNQPRRYLSSAWLDAVVQRMSRQREPLLVAMERAAVKPHEKRNVGQFVDFIQALRRKSWADRIQALLDLLIPPNATKQPEAQPDEDRPHLYRAAAKIAEKFTSGAELDAFVKRVIANTRTVAESDYTKAEDRVTLITAHKAKGLEWPVVYVSVTEGRFPTKRATPRTLPEERRLLYVAATRARDALTFAWARPDPKQKGKPSPLFRSIFPALIAATENKEPV